MAIRPLVLSPMSAPLFGLRRAVLDNMNTPLDHQVINDAVRAHRTSGVVCRNDVSKEKARRSYRDLRRSVGILADLWVELQVQSSLSRVRWQRQLFQSAACTNAARAAPRFKPPRRRP